MGPIITAALLLGVIALAGGILLVTAAKRFAVTEDERTESILSFLPGTNCGGCGYGSCLEYARAVAKGDPVNLCTMGGFSLSEKLAAVMGVKAGSTSQYKAFVACLGDADHTKRVYEYHGIPTCMACTLLYNGDVSCPYACLGYGDCEKACKFGAMHIENGLAKVDRDKCTGCGACRDACPKNLIYLYPAWSTSKPFVACISRQDEYDTTHQCTVGCTGCGICIRYCPFDAIKVKDNVAVVEPARCTGCGKCLGICPYNCIHTPFEGNISS